jgi:hypothetical protein
VAELIHKEAYYFPRVIMEEQKSLRTQITLTEIMDTHTVQYMETDLP